MRKGQLINGDENGADCRGDGSRVVEMESNIRGMGCMRMRPSPPRVNIRVTV